MLTQEEIDTYTNEFKEENLSLVSEALESCVADLGRTEFFTSCHMQNVERIKFWIAGWKKRDQALFTVGEAGFSGKFSIGGSITIPTDVVESNKQLLDGGHILVTESQFNLLGASFLRNINGTPHAEIIVISDDKYENMKPSERVEYLNNAITGGVRS